MAEAELAPELAEQIASAGPRTAAITKHLLAIELLADDDPEAAYVHAQAVRELGSRLAVCREVACIAAYRTGRYKEALKEEAAFRRISGSADLVAIAADCERGVGRPQKALEAAQRTDATRLDPDTRTELQIVVAGARADLGDVDAARVQLQSAIRGAKSNMARARARYALADLVLAGGDTTTARQWFQAAADIDAEGQWTDAAQRVLDLDGVVISDEEP